MSFLTHFAALMRHLSLSLIDISSNSDEPSITTSGELRPVFRKKRIGKSFFNRDFNFER